MNKSFKIIIVVLLLFTFISCTEQSPDFEWFKNEMIQGKYILKGLWDNFLSWFWPYIILMAVVFSLFFEYRKRKKNKKN